MSVRFENEGIVITASHIQAIIDHAVSAYPKEACGFVVGYENKAHQVIPIANISQSPDRFVMNPHEQVLVLTKVESLGMMLLGIYHSHPDGAETPSLVDIEEFQYPGILIIICSGNGKMWKVQCYIKCDNGFKLIPLKIVDDRDSDL